ncbi:hypothetical protein [Streptomyces sp. NPDC057250]|uniref:hypothetical protein n=1 Tax=Streptomyces sp. NPDC057250 TaxID=3346068 RepID=UPI00362FA2AF
MAFPQTPLDVRTELRIGGAWTPAEVYTRSPITIECGRSEESGQTNPGKLTLQLDNRTGKYTARNPRSPYYGLLGRNTPIRVSVPGTESYLELDGTESGVASTPHHASLGITADLDVRVEASIAWHNSLLNQSLIGKWGAPGQRSWCLRVYNRRLGLLWTENGTAVGFAEVQLPPMPYRAAVRATLDADNGAGGCTFTFYWARSLAGPWTQIDDPITFGGGPTSIFASTAPLTIAPTTAEGTPPRLPFTGTAYRAEVRAGIGGTVVAAPDFRAQPVGTTSFADTAGRTWTVSGSARIERRAYLHYGEAASWAPRWDVSGRDVWTPIESGGPLRRLGQGSKPLDSALRRRIPSYAPLAYWPCEDNKGAESAFTPLTGGGALAVTGFEFGQDDTLPGSSALPTVAPGGTMRGTVPAPATASTVWAWCMPFRIEGGAPATEQELFSWHTTGTIRRWRITMGASGTHLYGYDADGILTLDSSIVPIGGVFDGTWWRMEFLATQAGGNIDYELRWTQVGASWVSVTGSIAGSAGRVSQIGTTIGTGLEGLRIGHIGVFAAASVTAAYANADHGYNRETATNRLSRLAAEESRTVQLAVTTGNPTSTPERLGPQKPAPLLALLQEAADADGGILYESRSDPSLVYRDRTSLYNQTPKLVLDYTVDGEIGPPLEPVEDDQRTRNDITVTREGGGSARVTQDTGPMSTQAPPLGVGLYDDSVTLNLAEDAQARQIAAWRLHLGTRDEARYPTVRLMLHAAPHLIPAVLALEIGDLIRITNPPEWLPPGPIDLIVQGWSDQPEQYTWDRVLNCTPAGGWEVGVLDDPALGRLGTDGTTLGAPVTATDTSLVLLSNPGPPWISSATHPTEFPFDMELGGETVRVTAIRGVIEDSFTRSETSGWGTAESGQPWTRAGGNASDFLVTGGAGVQSATARGVLRATTVPIAVADVDLRTDLSMSAAPTTAHAEIFLMARRLSSADYYSARLLVAAGGALTLTLRRMVANTETDIATYATGLVLTGGTWYTLRFAVQGSSLSAKVWPRGSDEPALWQATATDTSLPLPGLAGPRTILTALTTNALPVNFLFDNFQSTPQQATVTRSRNGVVKAHPAGTSAQLLRPITLAL